MERFLKAAAFNGGNGEQIWKDIASAFEEENDGVKVELEISSELDKDLTKEINGTCPGCCLPSATWDRKGIYGDDAERKGLRISLTHLKERAKDKMLDGIPDSTHPAAIWRRKDLPGSDFLTR